MTRFNDKTDTTAASVRAFAERLRLLATQFEYQADSMDSHSLERVPVAYWKSVRNSLDGLGKFAGSIQEAITEAMVMRDFDAMVNRPGDAPKPEEDQSRPSSHEPKKPGKKK